MDNLKQRGRSRKRNQNRFLDCLIRGNRRKLSALLCASMVLNGTVTTFPVMAAEAENDVVSQIKLESSELWDALSDAVSDGSTVEAPVFSGDYSEEFETLFDDASGLYKLNQIEVTNNSELDVEIYAKVSSESLESVDSYNTGSVEFVFLVSNDDEAEAKSAQIVIDGKASGTVSVAAVGDVENGGKEAVHLDVPAEPSTEAPAESVQDPAGAAGKGQNGNGETAAEETRPEESLPAEETRPEESLPADSSEETVGSEEGTIPADETTEAPADVPEQGGDETPSDDETEAEVPETPAAEDGSEESQAPEEVPGTGDTVEDGSDVQPGTGDDSSVTAPDSSDEGQQEDSQPAEDSAPAEDSQQNGDSSSEPAGDSAPAADDSQSGSAEASDNSGEGVTVAALSVSLHNAPYLAASGDPLATDAESDDQTETLSTDDTAEENVLGGRWTVDTALMDGKAVMAYTVSGSELSNEIGLVWDDNAKTVEISNATGLRQWADAIREDSNRCDGYTVYIVNDIDLSGENWTSIISLGGTVTIDGQGHTISNMTIEEQNNSGSYTFLGFIGNLNYNTKLTVQNITFENAHVQDLNGDSEYSWCGVVVGHGPMDGISDSQAECTFTDVHVVNSVVTGGHNNGGIMGYSCSTETGHLFENCSVTDSFIGGYNSTSGILFGMGIANVTVRDCQADGVVLYSDGLSFNCTQSWTEEDVNKLWLGNVYPNEIYGGTQYIGTAMFEGTNDPGNSYVAYPVHFHIGNRIIKKYVPVNTDLKTFDNEWFGDIFDVGSGKNIHWYEGTTADAEEVEQITAGLPRDNVDDMYPNGKKHGNPDLINDEIYETQDTDRVDNPLTHGAIELYAKNAPTDPVNPDVPEWEKSKSKTATNLDENYESKVTLSLPAAQETLETDVVFVLDKSTSADVEADAIEMLQNLNNQVSETGASVKVGVVIFNKEANVLGLTQLNDENMSQITEAIQQDISSGTNTHAGLLAAKEMLDNDTSVAASRKYVIFVSDGITYMFDETANAINSQQASTGEYAIMAGNDCWGIRHYEEGGDKFVPSDWSAYLSDVGTHMDDVQKYIQPYGSMDSENHIPRGNTELPTTVDVALYKTAQVYSEMRAEGYRCYAMVADTGYGNQYPWGPSFMDYLANGKEVSFDEIQNDIYYLLDAGSTVVDEIGYGDDYDFAFVKPEEMVLTVSGQQQTMTPIEENHWGFGEQLENGKYSYEVTYYPDGSEEVTGEHFVWAINVPVTNFAPVELTYIVKLTNPHTEAGTYGRYDEDGSENYAGLYTNKDATLNPVDSNGYKGNSEKFQKPTVSYTVNGSSSTPAEWETSKSKTATELNENLESTVTLGLPSAQETLESDVVFVIDKSTSQGIRDDAIEMLDQLRTQVDETGAKVNVGVVIFNRIATKFGMYDLSTEEGFNQIKDAINYEISSGTNMHAGLLAAQEMLENDTNVADSRKYVVLISDGLSYYYCKGDNYGEAYTISSRNGGDTGTGGKNEAPNDGLSAWEIKYSSSYVPDDWNQYLSNVEAVLNTDYEMYEYSLNEDRPSLGDVDSEGSIPYAERENYPINVDLSLYYSNQLYKEMNSKYHCFAMLADTQVDSYGYGRSFMNYLMNGKEVSFANIQNDILYLLDAGSRVVDVIGEGTSNLGDPYDFTFINDISRMNLTVDGVALDKEEIGSVDGAYYSYGFGNRGDGNYRFVVNYYPGGTEDTEGEHFVWEINEAISNFAPVQFQYVVRLTTAPTADGTHGQYDGNGEHNYSGLLTNKEATLYPVDSNGTTYPAEDFPKPTVSYTVDNGGDTPVDPDPDKEQFTITINYYRRSDNAVLRDSETITLDADAAYNINDLVNMAISGYRWSNYSVPEGQTSDLTGTLTSNLVFNVYYVRTGSSGGGSGSSGGGPSGGGVYTPGGPGVTIEPEEVPLAPLPDTPTTIGEGEVPLSPLPKTGETSRRGWAVMMLSGALMAFAAVLNRKREEER